MGQLKTQTVTGYCVSDLHTTHSIAVCNTIFQILAILDKVLNKTNYKFPSVYMLYVCLEMLASIETMQT